MSFALSLMLLLGAEVTFTPPPLVAAEVKPPAAVPPPPPMPPPEPSTPSRTGAPAVDEPSVIAPRPSVTTPPSPPGPGPRTVITPRSGDGAATEWGAPPLITAQGVVLVPREASTPTAQPAVASGVSAPSASVAVAGATSGAPAGPAPVALSGPASSAPEASAVAAPAAGGQAQPVAAVAQEPEKASSSDGPLWQLAAYGTATLPTSLEGSDFLFGLRAELDVWRISAYATFDRTGTTPLTMNDTRAWTGALGYSLFLNKWLRVRALGAVSARTTDTTAIFAPAVGLTARLGWSFIGIEGAAVATPFGAFRQVDLRAEGVLAAGVFELHAGYRARYVDDSTGGTLSTLFASTPVAGPCVAIGLRL